MNSGVSNEYVPNLPGRYVHGLFCEQVRDELRGSQTFVGVLFSGLLVDTFPVTFPFLAVAAWIVIPVSSRLPRFRDACIFPERLLSRLARLRCHSSRSPLSKARGVSQA